MAARVRSRPRLAIVAHVTIRQPVAAVIIAAPLQAIAARVIARRRVRRAVLRHQRVAVAAIITGTTDGATPKRQRRQALRLRLERLFVYDCNRAFH